MLKFKKCLIIRSIKTTEFEEAKILAIRKLYHIDEENITEVIKKEL